MLKRYVCYIVHCCLVVVVVSIVVVLVVVFVIPPSNASIEHEWIYTSNLTLLS